MCHVGAEAKTRVIIRMAHDDNGFYSIFFTYFKALADKLRADALTLVGGGNRHGGQGCGLNFALTII